MLYRFTGLHPLPCPRPRLGRFGAYYPATYNAWKRKANRVIRGVIDGIPDHRPLDVPVSVWLLFAVPRPRTTKLVIPKPDIDNYMKSIFDACNGLIWTDDALVRSVTASKQWADVIESGIYMMVDIDDPTAIELPSARTVPEVREQRRSG